MREYEWYVLGVCMGVCVCVCVVDVIGVDRWVGGFRAGVSEV